MPTTMLGGKEYRCGLGFQVAEEIETDELQRWHMYVRPYLDECEIVPQPKSDYSGSHDPE